MNQLYLTDMVGVEYVWSTFDGITDMAAKKTGRNRRDAVNPSGAAFLPDYPEQVKAIAMRGLSDDEMAAVFGITRKTFQAWKAYYPSFKEAIEKGRTFADQMVVEALFTSATGLRMDGRKARKVKQQVVNLGDGDYTVVELEEEVLPKFEAQKYWLNNRQPEHWGDKVQVGGDRSPGAKPIGIEGGKVESKEEIIASILNLIPSKPD